MTSAEQKALPAPAAVARGALFIVYVWFGALKVIGLSPASDLVRALKERTLPFLEFGSFFVTFGALEVLIGLLMLVPRFTRLALGLLLLHVGTTVLPLFVLPEIAWQHGLVPSLEGQYIIKNVLILAAAMSIVARPRPASATTRPGFERSPAPRPAPERLSG